MAEYALLIADVFAEIRLLDERPPDIPHKHARWLPVLREYGDPPVEAVKGDSYIIRTIDPATLPPQVPASVSPRQARLALLMIGKLEAANTAVASSDTPTKIAWEFSLEIRRADPGVIALAASIGLSSDDLDTLFISAGSL